MHARLTLTASVSTLALLWVSGCTTTLPDRAQRMQRGYVYYLDGAGGGGVTNWSGGVREGMLAAGYDGAGEMFRWQTGLGVVADQTASNEYKRGQARKLARKIQEYVREHPNAPVTLMGLSAGTAIAAFTLESLPTGIQVEDVILLSGSLSSTYGLTAALRHVNGKMYIFTSHRDAVLQTLVPVSGTADRDSGTTSTIGMDGPRLPSGASTETHRLYATKIVEVPWKTEFSRYGNYGKHTDTVGAAFVERYVAPLVRTSSATRFLAAATAPAGRALNPDYRRWAQFAPGSWVILDGQLMVDGVAQQVRVKATLVRKTATTLIVEREDLTAVDRLGASPYPQQLFVSAHIDPSEHPMTHPAARVEELPNTKLSAGGHELDCRVKSVSAETAFRDWGDRPRATVYLNERIPGGVVQVELSTRFGQRAVTFTGKLTGFRAVRE